MGMLFQVTSVFFLTAIVSNTFFYLKLFEEKDYNTQRLIIHLRETKPGKSLITGRVSLLKWVLIFSYIVTIYISGIDFYYHIAISLFYGAIFVTVLRKIINREISFPKFSKITNIVFFLSLAIEAIFFVFAPVDHFLWMLILDKLLLVFIIIFLILLSVFVDFGRDIVINQAIEKINRNSKLLTIALVGSYGRGSTKEFISRILSLKFNVLVTRSTYETSFGIAETINSALTTKKQIFIADIDDYKQEDVAGMCELISPKIVVVCGINEQKLSAFNNIKNILDSKMEAVKSLSRDGFALFNGNSEYVQQLYNATKGKKFLYKVGKNGTQADILAGSIVEGKFGISFAVNVFGKSYKFSNIKLLGRQNIENLLPGIFIGVYAGIDFSKIRRALAAVRPLQGTMAPLRSNSGAILIDDTYNANINSVLRALSYMRLYKGKKIMVFEPLVELGKISKETHFDLGFEIGKVCDMLILTNENYAKSIREGIDESGSNTNMMIAYPSKIIKYVLKECGKEDVVVFEGKEAAIPLSGIGAERVY